MVYSVIKLFPPDATDFTTNGLGLLSEATSCVVTEEANGSFELEMVYPVSGKRFKDITTRSIIVAKPNPVDTPQAFRVYEYSKPMNGQVTFNAAHISYDLSGYPVKPFSASTSSDVIAKIPSYFVTKNNFRFWTDMNRNGTFKLEKPTPARSVLGGMEGSILDVFHGEYKFDNFLVRLYGQRGMDRGVTIRYGKNLTDVKQEENCADVYTHILPFWYGEVDEVNTLVTLPELILPTKGTYNYTKVGIVDFTSDFDEIPLVVDLRARANTYISDNDLGVPKISIDVSFIQLEQSEEFEELALLERVELFDTISVIFEEFGLSAKAKVSKTVFNALSGRYNSVTLGDVQALMSDTVASQNGQLDGLGSGLDASMKHMNSLADQTGKLMQQTKTDLQLAIDNATKWITNGTGYIVAVKDGAGNWTEICSLNTPNINTATHVWRWNNSGFGYSSRGYNGPYTTAITQDGKIVADFIVTGNLSASLVTMGTMKADRIYGGTLKMGGTETNTDGLIELYDEKGVQYGQIGHYTQLGMVRLSSIYAPYNSLLGGDCIISLSDEGTNVYTSLTMHSEYGGRSSGFSLVAKSGGRNWNLLSIYGAIDEYYQPESPPDDDVILEGPFTGGFILGQLFDVIIDKLIAIEKIENVHPISTFGYRVMDVAKQTTSLVSDVGIGETDEEGSCYIFFDDLFYNGTSTNLEYYVFLQKEGPGDIWVSKKDTNYFLVEGTPNLKFSWEVKAKDSRVDYERLETYRSADPDTDYVVTYEEEMKEIKEQKEQEEILLEQDRLGVIKGKEII